MPRLKIEFPPYISAVLSRLREAGHSAYIVGGCVRDSLIGRAPHDWDVTTSARPQVICELFSASPFCVCDDSGAKYGTVRVKHKCGEVCEITTFRCDGEYSDHRRPDKIAFSDSIEADLARRDFTVNSVAAMPDLSGNIRIVDPFNGIADMKDRVIRTVGDPRRRFREDSLRILRAHRFKAELNFAIESETLEQTQKLAPMLSYVSKERITYELLRMFDGEHFAPDRDVIAAAFPPVCDRFFDAFASEDVPLSAEVRIALMLPHKGDASVLTRYLRFGGKTVQTVQRLISLDPPSSIGDVCNVMRLFDDDLALAAEYLKYVPHTNGDIVGKALLDYGDFVNLHGIPYKPSMLAVGGDEAVRAGFTGRDIGVDLDELLLQVQTGKLANEKAALIEALKNRTRK